jgi:LPXTG-site transpeptidase (sortase) family protein
MKHWFQIANTMGGIARTQALLGLAALGLLAGGGVLGFVLLSSGGSDEEAPIVQATATATVAVTPPPTEEAPPLTESYRMLIEKIGVDAPIATYGLDENRVPLVPTGPDAAEVVAWYDFSARPGTGSNAVFAGHVTWNGDAVFRNLNTLQTGDIVRLRDDRGAEMAYRVVSNVAVDPSDPESLKVMSPTETEQVTIITCGGEYFQTDDPVAGGDYTHRVIIKAELESVTRAPA